MRFKVPFLGYLLAFIGLLLPPAVFVAALPSLINTQPVRDRLVGELSKWTGGQVNVAGTVTVESSITISVDVTDVEITHLKNLPAVTGLKARKIEARVSPIDLLFGKLSFDKVRIDNAVITINAKDPREATASILAMLSGPQENPFAAFQLSDSLVAMREGVGKPYRRLHVDSAQMTVQKSTGEISGRGSLRWAGEPVNFSLRKGLASERAEARAPLRLQADGPLFAGQFDGESTFAGGWEATGTFALRTPDPARFYAWLGIKPGTVTNDALDFKGVLDLHGDQASLRSLAVTLGGQSASGNLTLQMAGVAPRLEGTLTFATLDLDRMLDTGCGTARLLTMAATDNVDLRIAADAVSWQGIKSGAAAFTLNARPGFVALEIAELELLDGAVRGQVAVNTNERPFRAQTRLSAEGINAAGLMELLKQQDWLSGKADANVEAELVWSPGDGGLLSATAGKARVSFAEGGQMRLDIPRLANAASATAIEGWGATDFATTNFDDLRFMLMLKDGQLRFDHLELAAKDEFVTGAGWIDFTGKTLDVRLAVTPEVAGVERRVGMTAQSAATQPTAGLSIKGAWSQPVIRAEMSQSGDVTAAISKAAAALEVPERGR